MPLSLASRLSCSRTRYITTLIISHPPPTLHPISPLQRHCIPSQHLHPPPPGRDSRQHCCSRVLFAFQAPPLHRACKRCTSAVTPSFTSPQPSCCRTFFPPLTAFIDVGTPLHFDMNEDLAERFGRLRTGAGPTDQAQVGSRADVWVLPPRLNPRVKEYFEGDAADGGSWLSRPEIPSSAELLDNDTGSSSFLPEVVHLYPNKPKGAFDSKEHYLSTQHELLREDAIRPLREAVAAVRHTPTDAEDGFQAQIGIYEKASVIEAPSNLHQLTPCTCRSISAPSSSQHAASRFASLSVSPALARKSYGSSPRDSSLAASLC